MSATIPKTAQAVYIGLIPDLDFKVICYETKNGFYVQVNNNEPTKVTGYGYFQTSAKGRCIKDAWTLDTGGYAEATFDRECTPAFLRSMLDHSCQIAGITHKNCYILERLKW